MLNQLDGEISPEYSQLIDMEENPHKYKELNQRKLYNVKENNWLQLLVNARLAELSGNHSLSVQYYQQASAIDERVGYFSERFYRHVFSPKLLEVELLGKPFEEVANKINDIGIGEEVYTSQSNLKYIKLKKNNKELLGVGFALDENGNIFQVSQYFGANPLVIDALRKRLNLLLHEQQNQWFTHTMRFQMFKINNESYRLVTTLI
jgi:hypothetical protein